MFKNKVAVVTTLAGAVMLALPASGQAPTTPATPPSTVSATDRQAQAPAGADLRKLIGRDVKNAANETIGEIESVFLRSDGSVDGVMVSVGGFLGMGEREVKVGWNDLKISRNGENVTVNMTRDQLKALPEYKYADRTWRGQVFTERGPWTPEQSRNTAAARESWENFSSLGSVSGSAIMGATVRNQNRETLGEVEEIYVGKDGKIDEIIISVGGFLGMGEKNVAVKWSDVRIDREGDDLIVNADWTKEKVKAMPDRKRPQQAEKPR
jgi:uncharacterized protein YrrD